MNWRKLNRAIHRDIGYFFFGMCIIYGISGIALNHRHQWNPNFIINQQDYQLDINQFSIQDPDKSLAMELLTTLDGNYTYRTHLLIGQGIRIFIEGGTYTVNLNTGRAQLETIRKRPVFNEFNFLHYNTPKKIWTWFSDLFAAALVVLAATGLFVLKGKHGLAHRGIYLATAGIIIPMVILYLYL
jgi:uncharacterized protein